MGEKKKVRLTKRDFIPIGIAPRGNLSDEEKKLAVIITAMIAVIFALAPNFILPYLGFWGFVVLIFSFGIGGIIFLILKYRR